MTSEQFLDLLAKLTGSPAKGVTPRDEEHLSIALKDDTGRIDASQFNELVLLANKDRVTSAFFAHFFCAQGGEADCSVGDLPTGVEKFQKLAMLSFGNFIYAYRRLSKLATVGDIEAALGRYALPSDGLEEERRRRRPSILDITPIKREDTYFVGYLSVGAIAVDRKRAGLIGGLLKDGPIPDWASLESAIENSYTDENEAKSTLDVANRCRTLLKASDAPAALLPVLADGLKEIDKTEERLKSVRAVAVRNTDVYLTWDHMDVYFATSMRKRWEYEDLYDFASSIMARGELKALNLRYFDPTQSFDEHRISKGLIEALMLKRATCTVYSVQDTDTLGKDSELAATLAQGKPVIAYAPRVDVLERAGKLARETPLTVRERLDFVLFQDEPSKRMLAEPVLQEFATAAEEYEACTPWRSLPQDKAAAKFREKHADLLAQVCSIVAEGERRIYNSRAGTLQNIHPLGVQVHLDTGVANGVLVARDVEMCAELIRRIVTNRLEFDLDDSDKDYWLLRERLTQCVYRLVSRSQKLTNCFWNFYRHDLSQGAIQ